VLPIHPAANLITPLSPDEFRAPCEDIRLNGQRVPIVIFHEEGKPGQLLDGRHRLDAMEKAGVPLVGDNGDFDCTQAEIKYVYTRDGVDPHAYVLSANVHRRHLGSKQKDELIARVLQAKPEMSDRAIAAAIKADKRKVKAVRAKQESTGTIAPVEKRIGKDGRARKPPVKKLEPVAEFVPDAQERSTRAPAPAVTKQTATARHGFELRAGAPVNG
jgi:hypothetical protein